MSEHDTEVYISLDFKKHRIRVYKQTLGYMGNPDYVYLLIDPKEQQIGLFSSKVNAPDAHKVDLKKLGSDNSYELYSKSLFYNIVDGEIISKKSLRCASCFEVRTGTFFFFLGIGIPPSFNRV